MTGQPPDTGPQRGWSQPTPAYGGYPANPSAAAGSHAPRTSPARGTYSPAALPREAYTGWGARAAAWLIDCIPPLLVIGIGFTLLATTQSTDCAAEVSEFDIGPYCSTGASTLGLAAFWIATAASIAYLAWDYGYRQGRTGSSIGKSVLKFKVVSESTGQPIGFGMSLIRQIMHFVDQVVFFIGYLNPLWDAKRQTLADKIMRTVCLPTA
jgi:uncharacterized RDD family membrane protein YckC